MYITLSELLFDPNEILFNNKKDKVFMPAAMYINLENMLSDECHL